jgi:hypothetical protein
LGRRAAIAASPLRQPGARLWSWLPRGSPSSIRGSLPAYAGAALAAFEGRISVCCGRPSRRSAARARRRAMYASRLSTTKADRYGFEFAFSDQLPHFRVANVPKLGSGARDWHEQGSEFVIGALLIPRPHWSHQRLERPCLIVIALQRR